MYKSRKVALIVGDRVCTDELRGPLCRISHSPHAMVAIIGDEPVESLKSRFRLPGVFYMGDQGLQISGPGVETEPEPGLLHMALQLLTQEVKSRVEPIRGSHVEVGTLTCNVDYRSVSPRRRGQVRRAVASAVFEVRQLFRCQEEQGVCTLRPNVEWSRPTAVRWVLANAAKPSDAVIYIGNDHGDEEVYRSLPDAITVKVGDPQKTMARYTLGSTKELARFLSWLDVTLSMR
ncbi:MAG: trehalose-phosphatase [Bryobacteraceae bacterium]